MQQLKFLIVEDEALAALYLQRSLVRAGHLVCGLAVSGEKAIQAAREEKPDVILMDIGLLGALDGIETARQIIAFLPANIVFTTGYSHAELRAQAMALRPAAYLVKPVDVRQIEAALEPLYG